MRILRSKYAVDFVVGCHYRTNIGVLYGSLEGRQIDFAQRALVNVRTDREPVLLLIVGGVVLHLSNHTLALNAANLSRGHLRRKVWIFAKGFEITSAFGNSHDVDHWAQEDVLPFGFRFGTQGSA